MLLHFKGFIVFFCWYNFQVAPYDPTLVQYHYWLVDSPQLIEFYPAAIKHGIPRPQGRKENPTSLDDVNAH